MDQISIFTGVENVYSWTSKVELYCWMHEIEEEYQLCIGLEHIEGDALDWVYQWWHKAVGWSEFKNAIREKFGGRNSDMKALEFDESSSNTIPDQQNGFEALLMKLRKMVDGDTEKEKSIEDDSKEIDDMISVIDSQISDVENGEDDEAEEPLKVDVDEIDVADLKLMDFVADNSSRSGLEEAATDMNFCYPKKIFWLAWVEQEEDDALQRGLLPENPSLPPGLSIPILPSPFQNICSLKVGFIKHAWAQVIFGTEDKKLILCMACLFEARIWAPKGGTKIIIGLDKNIYQGLFIHRLEIENNPQDREQAIVARLVLILRLEDRLAIAKAAQPIADACINEHMHFSFKEADPVKQLIQLINHPGDSVRLAVVQASDRMYFSNIACLKIVARVLHPIENCLKQSKSEIPDSLTAMILNVFSRILGPKEEMKSKFNDGPVNGWQKEWDLTGHPASAEGNKMFPSELSTLDSAGCDLVHFTFLSCLMDFLKTPDPNLQRKSASVLKFILVVKPCGEKLISADRESGLEVVFRQKSLVKVEYDNEEEKPEVYILELEEASQAVSTASRLLTKLLRTILVSTIPFQNEGWVAACLVKLSSLSGQNLDLENSINTKLTLNERLILLGSSYALNVQEATVLELNRILFEGMIDPTRTIASEGEHFLKRELPWLHKILEDKLAFRDVWANMEVLIQLKILTSCFYSIYASAYGYRWVFDPGGRLSYIVIRSPGRRWLQLLKRNHSSNSRLQHKMLLECFHLLSGKKRRE